MALKGKTIQDCLDVQGLIQALPEGINEDSAGNDPVQELFANISSRTVPVGSLTRMWVLGGMQAKITIGYLAYALRKGFLNETEKQKLLNETHLAAALKVFGTMGYLRGAIMKVGQMLGSLPTVMPKEFTDVLDNLHFEAPPMHYSMIREMFFNEMGKDPEEFFSYFDRNAFAAASLGQVHRARLKTGEEVAVKIQYPAMADTIQNDIRNLKLILAPMRLTKEWDYISNHLQDAEEMLQQETDYEQEAAFMEQAYELFNDNEEIVVPKYYKEYSTKKVLTMDYLNGKMVKDFIKKDPSLASRNHFGKLISTAIMRLSYCSRSFYTDPHPGNFIMMDNGKLGFIDFGSHRKLTAEEWEASNNGEKALMLTRDEEMLERSIAFGCFHADVNEMDLGRVELLKKSARWLAEPAQEDGPFDFSDDDWYQRGVDINLEIMRQHQSRYAPVWNWTNRSLLGHRTLMYLLKCNFNFRKLYLEDNPFVAGETRPGM